jgi:DNA-binding FadR family transcriptional regulator
MTVSFSAIQPGLKLADQVARQLEARIRAGNLQPGQKLPTEAELVQQLEVSRTVVREAVSQLKSRNLVESRQGSGVYVKAAPRGACLGRLFGSGARSWNRNHWRDRAVRPCLERPGRSRP